MLSPRHEDLNTASNLRLPLKKKKKNRWKNTESFICWPQKVRSVESVFCYGKDSLLTSLRFLGLCVDIPGPAPGVM